MDNQITLKDKIKGQTILVILYLISEFMIWIFVLDKNYLDNWEGIFAKNIVIVGLVGFVTLLFNSITKLNNRKKFCYLGGIECILVSLILLNELLNRYYNLYEKLGLEIICIYLAVVVILFLLCKNYYKKLPSEKQLDKKRKMEQGKGMAYIVAASTIGFARHLTVNGRHTIGIILSIVICCAWLTLGWFMFQGKKAYLDELSKDVETE